MKQLILATVMVLLSASAFGADSFHVTGIHKATRDDEKTYHTAFNQNIITGVVGNRRYTLEQLASWGFYHFEVGVDYEVLKADDKALTLKVQDKKGRDSKERLNVVTVEEAP